MPLFQDKRSRTLSVSTLNSTLPPSRHQSCAGSRRRALQPATPNFLFLSSSRGLSAALNRHLCAVAAGRDRRDWKCKGKKKLSLVSLLKGHQVTGLCRSHSSKNIYASDNGMNLGAIVKYHQLSEVLTDEEEDSCTAESGCCIKQDKLNLCSAGFFFVFFY